MAGWLTACSKSNAATLAEDESSIHHGDGDDDDHDDDEDDGHGHHRHCHRHGHGPSRCVTTDRYDDFSDGATYSDRWFDVSSFVGNVEPEALSSRAFGGGRLHIEATPFMTSSDNVLDHMKYFAVSTQSWEVPLRGSIEVSADVDATTSGTVNERRCHHSNDRMFQGRQAAVTVELIDTSATGIHLAWYISSNRAIALYERLSPDGSCDLDHNFTQVVQEIGISPGTHTFAIRYLRNTGANGFGDKVGWILDGQFRAEVHGVGIPLGDHHANRNTTFPAQGNGERLDNVLNRFNIGHGLATMVDEYPFNQCATGQHSIPTEDRIFGQGAIGNWDNFRVTTEDL